MEAREFSFDVTGYCIPALLVCSFCQNFIRNPHPGSFGGGASWCSAGTLVVALVVEVETKALPSDP